MISCICNVVACMWTQTLQLHDYIHVRDKVIVIINTVKFNTNNNTRGMTCLVLVLKMFKFKQNIITLLYVESNFYTFNLSRSTKYVHYVTHLSLCSMQRKHVYRGACFWSVLLRYNQCSTSNTAIVCFYWAYTITWVGQMLHSNYTHLLQF